MEEINITGNDHFNINNPISWDHGSITPMGGLRLSFYWPHNSHIRPRDKTCFVYQLKS